jgi:3-oxoacyl-ACP reductase-like protein
MGQARQRCHCEVGVRHRGSAVAQFIWIMGEIARRETNRVGWISKKLLEKAD